MAYMDHTFSNSDEDIMMETYYSINNSPLVKEITLAISLFVFGLVGIILDSFMTYNRIGGDRGHDFFRRVLLSFKTEIKGKLKSKYFNYMGMLAVEGTYDKMEALLIQNIHPVDILLMLAMSEGDKPKIEELLKAGATYNVKDADGRTALYRGSEEIKDFILVFSVQKS